MSAPHTTAVDLALDERFRAWVNHPTPALDAHWQAYFAQHPDCQALLPEARMLVRQLRVNATVPSPDTLQRLWMQIQAQTGPDAAVYPATGRVRALPQSTTSRWTAPRWAAVWVGLLMLAGLAYVGWLRTRPTTYQTAYGQVQTITLPDGSVATLNGNSTLTVPANWAGDRHVTLAGEAFFHVAKQRDPEGRAVKFRVQTPNLTVEVLGTQFNVSHRRNHTRVVLQEGRVRVTGPQATPAILRPGEMISYTKGRSLQKSVVKAQQYTAWRDRLLIFTDTPVAEIVQELADSRGVRMELRQAELAGRRFSGSFPADSVEVFLTKLEKLYGVSVRREQATDGSRHYVID